MTQERSFETALMASEGLGKVYAAHIFAKGITENGFTEEERQVYSCLFREMARTSWEQTNGAPLSAYRLNLLEETFDRNFKITLGSYSRGEI